MTKVTLVGVRHHSPACALLVRHVVERESPRFVLVEGPCDMNDRMGELALPHELPVALYTWRQDESSPVVRGTWTPFCAYSPEWVALAAARARGATPLFVDLPAWHDAFEGEDNRYSDRRARTSEALAKLADRLGLEGTDPLWDHLFEAPRPLDDLARHLARYFEELRGDEDAGPRDGPRELHMARWIAWAKARCDREPGGGGVVVVCGGWHAPALARAWPPLVEAAGEAPPEVPDAPPATTRTGSYLVPFSFKRLDAFAGYASGMPSPAFYQAVWDEGPSAGADAMMNAAIRHLRARGQRVSVADAIAARTLAEGLRMLRGHEALLRTDVLDGLAGALVKDALDAPLPWTRRGDLRVRTDPMLVELVAAFSGDRTGALAEGTPRPPLSTHVERELQRVGVPLAPEPRQVRADLATDEGRARSQVLHRLAALDIPGIELTRAASFARGKTRLDEEWRVGRGLETDAALIVAARHGATLEAAAAGSLEERCAAAGDLPALADVLVRAAWAGLDVLTTRWLALVLDRVASEASLAALGAALGLVLRLHGGQLTLGHAVAASWGRIVEACFERGLWLFESTTGEAAPYDAREVAAVAALRDAAALASEQGDDAGAPTLDVARALAVCGRRTRDATAPPALRGAALGFTCSIRGADGDRDDPAAHVASVARAATFGDFLAGLFALAREEVTRSPDLLAAIDAGVTSFGPEDFYIALPSLRLAFSFFPPRERRDIAVALVADQDGVDASTLVARRVDPEAAASGFRREATAAATAHRFGLEDEPS